MIATHTAREVALAILHRRHKRLLASVNLRAMPAHEVWWGGECRKWAKLFPGART